MIGKALNEIIHFQKLRYQAEPIQPILAYFVGLEPQSDDEIYQASLACEPRAGSGGEAPSLRRAQTSHGLTRDAGGGSFRGAPLPKPPSALVRSASKTSVKDGLKKAGSLARSASAMSTSALDKGRERVNSFKSR